MKQGGRTDDPSDAQSPIRTLVTVREGGPRERLLALDADGGGTGVLLDKLGERLAFACATARLYASLACKYDAQGTWPGGPSRATFELLGADEERHAELLREAMRTLGGDPGAETPAAEVVQVAAQGLPAVVNHPGTTLEQCLEAMLIAETTDSASWELLVQLAEDVGHVTLAELFEEALDTAGEHLVLAKQWLSAGARHAVALEEEAAASS